MVGARDLGLLGEEDTTHLERATRDGRVQVTTDADFLQLAAAGMQHAGIVFGVQEGRTIGDWVRDLELICFVYSADEMVNHGEYL
ncbi:MAG: DUF5615 family PIN-like protein [Candidatus Promineifilaceae bacterium]